MSHHVTIRVLTFVLCYTLGINLWLILWDLLPINAASLHLEGRLCVGD